MKKLSTEVHKIACDIARIKQRVTQFQQCILCLVFYRTLSFFPLRKSLSAINLCVIILLVLRVILISHVPDAYSSVQDTPALNTANPPKNAKSVKLIKVRESLINEFIARPVDDALDFERLADAIKRAENSKTKPYGIMKDYCTSKTEAQCRKGCLQTIRKRYRMWLDTRPATRDAKTFIYYLAGSYAPLNAKNDPTGLNKNWIKNVRYFYELPA